MSRRDRDWRLETRDRDSKISAFCRIKKNIVITSKLNFFQISGIFPNCFGCFLPANTTNKQLLNYINFTVPFLCNSQSIETCSFETETRPETFETESRKNGSRDESRDRNQVSRLHHWQLFTYAVWFYSNHTRYPTTLRRKTRTKFALIQLKVELNWYLKLCYHWCIQCVLFARLFHFSLPVTKLTVALSVGLLYHWYLHSSMFKCILKFSGWFFDFSTVKLAVYLKPPSRANDRAILAHWKDITTPLGLYFNPQRAIWVIAKLTF